MRIIYEKNAIESNEINFQLLLTYHALHQKISLLSKISQTHRYRVITQLFNKYRLQTPIARLSILFMSTQGHTRQKVVCHHVYVVRNELHLHALV